MSTRAAALVRPAFHLLFACLVLAWSPASAETPQEDETMVLGEAGLSVLPPNMTLSTEALQKHFATLQVEASTHSAEGETYAEYVVRDGKHTVLRIEPGADGRAEGIIALDKRVEGPKGLHVGSTYEDVTKVGAATCYRGAEANYGLAYCEVEGIAQPRLVLALGDAEDKKGCDSVPVDPTCLRAKVVVQLSWFRE